MFSQTRCARFEMADERSELHCAEIVTLDGCAHLIGDGDFAQQFFFDFTTQRLTTALPRLDLTAGEFPVVSVPTVSFSSTMNPPLRSNDYSEQIQDTAKSHFFDTSDSQEIKSISGILQIPLV